MELKNVIRAAIISSAISSLPNAFANFANKDIKTINNQKIYGLELGGTRVIYKLDSNSVSLRVKNTQPYPVLVQPTVYNEDRKTEGPFLVTPPIQRMEPDTQTRLRIILTNEEISQDKESLFWLCVKGVPPVNIGDEESSKKDYAEINVNVLSNSCIKLITRPDSIKITPVKASEKIKWSIRGNEIIAKNNSPLYINFSSVNFNGTEAKLQERYIKPYSEMKFRINTKKATNSIEWSVYDDYGAESPVQKSVL